MPHISVLSWRHFRRVAVATSVVGLALALGFSLLMPLQYSASMRLLITQTTQAQSTAAALDPYTAIKANERIAASMTELVYTSTFYNSVMSQARGFDASYFPADEYNKRKLWSESIGTSVTPGTGIMTVTVYHPSRDQARILVQAAASQLAVSATNYFGSGVRVQVIDAPLDSRWYAKPNFVSNGLFGLFVGLLIGVGWALLGFSRREIFR